MEFGIWDKWIKTAKEQEEEFEPYTRIRVIESNSGNKVYIAEFVYADVMFESTTGYGVQYINSFTTKKEAKEAIDRFWMNQTKSVTFEKYP
jgi:hypothetical protein